MSQWWTSLLTYTCIIHPIDFNELKPIYCLNDLAHRVLISCWYGPIKCHWPMGAGPAFPQYNDDPIIDNDNALKSHVEWMNNWYHWYSLWPSFTIWNQTSWKPLVQVMAYGTYCQISDICCNKYPNLNVSRLVLQLSLPSPLKLGFKSSEDVVGAAPTGDAPTTSEWSSILLPTKPFLWCAELLMFGTLKTNFSEI